MTSIYGISKGPHILKATKYSLWNVELYIIVRSTKTEQYLTVNYKKRAFVPKEQMKLYLILSSKG